MTIPTFYDRVQETSTTTGTGTLTLAGAVTGYQSFSVVGNSNKTYYCITDGTNWEVGQGTYTSSGTTLSRDTIYASSNSGSAVNFPSGTKNVFQPDPATFLNALPTGSGTNNTLAKWTATGAPSTLGNSQITDDGSTVTVNGSTSVVLQGNSNTAISINSSGQLTHDLTFEAAAHNISSAQAATDTAGSSLTVTAGASGAGSSAAGKTGGSASVIGGQGGAGTASLNPGNGGQVILTAGAAGTNNGHLSSQLNAGRGGAVTITAGAGTGSSGTIPGAAGGNANLTGGHGGAGAGTGGSLGGAVGGGASVNGGSGGDASTGSGAGGTGGSVSLSAGPGGAGTSTGNTGSGGTASVTGGTGGDATNSGAGTGGTGGNTTVAGGTGGQGSATIAAGGGGTLTLKGGGGGVNNGGGGGNGGNLTIDGGAATGSGTGGTVSIGTTNASSTTVGSTAVTTTINGGPVTISSAASSSYTVSSGNLTLDAASTINLGTTNATNITGGNASTLFYGFSGIFPGFINGLGVQYASSTSLNVATGYARDKSDYFTIHVSSPAAIGTGGIGTGGMDKTSISGTVSSNSSNATITGSGTSFLTAFTTRTGSGTISGASTTITGSGTKFLSEVAVNDLIGTNAKGYSLVTAIASDTSLTISVAIPGGDPSGTAPVVIENAWWQTNAQTVRQIKSITSNTSMTLAANSSATESGVTGYISAVPSGQTYLTVWVSNGNSGTTSFLSTQRTTPFAPSGYSTYVRRIAGVMWTGSAFVPFSQWGSTNDRWYMLETGENTSGTQLLSGGTAGATWTAVTSASGILPPSTVALQLQVAAGTGDAVYIRKRSTGTSTTTRNNDLQNPVTSGGQRLRANWMYPCDGAQCIDYATVLGVNTDIQLGGYQETV